MAQTYTGTAAYTNTITIPDDGDPAAAASVNNPAKSEADMNMFLLQSIGLMPQSTSAITLSCINRTSVVVSPISSIIVNDIGNYKTIGTAAVSSVGIAQVEGGPAQFAPNTWYYIYAFSNLGTLNFIIRTVRPDTWNMFALGSDVQRYIGCFRTDGNAVPGIYPFVMSRGNYTYLDKLSAGGGNSTVEATVLTSSYVPPTSRLARLLYYYRNTGLAATFTLYPFTGLTGYVINARVGPDTEENGFVEMPTATNQNIRYVVSANTLAIDIAVNGFHE